jgi:hypothetical protein
VPIVHFWGGKGKRYPFYRYSSLNCRGIIDVHIVVEINEIITACLTEYGHADSGKEQVYTDSYTAPVNAAW